MGWCPCSTAWVNVQGLNGWGLTDRRLEVGVDPLRIRARPFHAVEDEGSFSASEIDDLRRVRDEPAVAWVEVRVSGRGDYQAEMLDLVERLLADGGYASDDHSGHLWSLTQIHQARATGQILRA
jgi:hypothetical protein